MIPCTLQIGAGHFYIKKYQNRIIYTKQKKIFLKYDIKVENWE